MGGGPGCRRRPDHGFSVTETQAFALPAPGQSQKQSPGVVCPPSRRAAASPACPESPRGRRPAACPAPSLGRPGAQTPPAAEAAKGRWPGDAGWKPPPLPTVRASVDQIPAAAAGSGALRGAGGSRENQ